MRKILLFSLLIIPFIANSQDLIILRSGEYVECKITGVDSSSIHYDFIRGERKLSSFVNMADVKSYQLNSVDNISTVTSDSVQQNQTRVVEIDTTKFVKETNSWVNLLTYSQRYGVHASGWSAQYYGYNLSNMFKWVIPMVFGLEGFEINTDYFSQSNYMSVKMNYFMAGISPFYKVSDNIYFNLGAQIIFGEEFLTDFYKEESSNTLFGIAPAQGIYFIPKSKVGILLGVGVYEKLLSSEVYKNDIGIKLEIGIKF